jgi:hypothetical protein
MNDQTRAKSGPSSAVLLQRASSELAELHRLLERVRRQHGGDDFTNAPGDDDLEPDKQDMQALGSLARNLISERRLRDRMFGPSRLFGEPAWDILLDLFAAKVDGTPVPVSSACVGSANPATTALRYLTSMEKLGLVERFPSPFDGRVANVTLTDSAMRQMVAYLREIAVSRSIPLEQ